jgi:hypothetical protein
MSLFRDPARTFIMLREGQRGGKFPVFLYIPPTHRVSTEAKNRHFGS